MSVIIIIESIETIEIFTISSFSYSKRYCLLVIMVIILTFVYSNYIGNGPFESYSAISYLRYE